MVLIESSDIVNEKIPVNFNGVWLRHYPCETTFRKACRKREGKLFNLSSYSLTNGFSVFKILPLGCSCITECC